MVKYQNYPVDRWKNAFAAISTQLEEISSGKSKVVDPEDREQQIASLASTDPVIEFRVEGKEVVLDHQNLEKVQVNYYLMDIELLFSRNPFVQEFGEEFGLIRPNISQPLPLKKDQRTTKFAIPKELQTSNVLVEIVGGGQTKVQAAYANELSELRPGKGDRPHLRQAAAENVREGIRSDARRANQVLQRRLHRSPCKFDYGSVSTNELDNVKKFSLLVMSEERGSLIREAVPPKR